MCPDMFSFFAQQQGAMFRKRFLVVRFVMRTHQGGIVASSMGTCSLF